MIDAAYCLCLDKRRDLWPAIERSMNELLLLPLRKFIVGDGTDETLLYDRVDTTNSDVLRSVMPNWAEHSFRTHANVFLSHRMMLEECVRRKYDSVIFLEDDCYLIENRIKQVFFSSKVQEFIHKGDWSAIYLGYQAREHAADTTDNLERAEFAWKERGEFDIVRVRPMYNSISGFHGILLNKSLIRHLSQISTGPMDRALQAFYAMYKLYYLEPKVVGCFSSWSFAENKFQQRYEIQ